MKTVKKASRLGRSPLGEPEKKPALQSPPHVFVTAPVSALTATSFENLSPKERAEETMKFFESFLDCQVLLGHIAGKQADVILSTVLQYGAACADIRQGQCLKEQSPKVSL